VRPGHAAPQCCDFGFQRGLGIGIGGAMDGHRRFSSPGYFDGCTSKPSFLIRS
jgi:hypothetical protein